MNEKAMNENNKIPKGYQEAGTFTIETAGLPKMNITEQAVSPKPTLKERHDKGVELTVDDKSKIISSIMLGYNKNEILLENGDYVTIEDISNAIRTEIERQAEDIIVVSKKTGKKLDDKVLEKIFEMAVKNCGKISISDGYDSITNANSNKRIITSAKTGREVSSPVIISKDGIQIPHGEYINSEEVLKALSEYIMVAPIPRDKEYRENSHNSEDIKHKNIVVRITSKYKPRFVKVLCGVAVSAVLLSGFAVTSKMVNKPVNDPIVVDVTQNDLNYNVSTDGKTYTFSTEEGLFEFLDKIELNSKQKIDNGDAFSEYGNSGLQKSIGKEFSKEGKEAGYYAITGFAIYDNSGNLYYVQQFGNENSYTSNMQQNVQKLDDFVELVLKENPQLTVDDLDVRIHFGSNLDNSRLGWISLDDYVKDGKIEIESTNSNPESYSGIIENFDGDFITINNGSSDVVISVKDKDGNLVQPGSIVIGNDGQQYIFDDINVKENIKMVESETAGYTQETKKSIEWNLKNCNLLIGSLPLTIALASYLKSKKLNERAKKDVLNKSFIDEEKYQKFKEEFEQMKVKYEGKSKFAKLFIKKQNFIQRLTPEQVQGIYELIRMQYGNDCEIRVLDDQFQVIYEDGRVVSLPEELLEQIHDVGKDNEYAAHTR